MRISDWSSDVCSSDLVALAQRRDFRIDALEQALLGIAPADALLELAPHRCRFVRTGACLVELEHVGVVRVLRLPRRARVGDHRRDQLAQRRPRRELRERVAEALPHLAADDSGERGYVLPVCHPWPTAELALKVG